METAEREKFTKLRQQKLIQLEANFIQKQMAEMNALKRRLEANLNERMRLRQSEHDNVLKRYHNAQKEAEKQQTNERNRFDKENMHMHHGRVSNEMNAQNAMQNKMQGSKLMSPSKKEKSFASPASRPS